MKHNIKMIGLDLDGTLLTTQKELTEYSKQVLIQAMTQGIIVLASTGRPISAIPKELLSLPGMRYAVTANGARVLDLETDEVLYESTLPVNVAEQLMNIIDEYDAILEIFVKGKSYIDQEIYRHVYDYYENPSMAEYVIQTRIPVDNLWKTLHEKNLGVDKVHGIFKNKSEENEARERLQAIPGVTVTGSLGNNLEVNRAGTDKGTGLLGLGEKLGILPEEIMAFGDGLNDLEMLKAVGVSVAMENGHPSLKEVADYIAPPNDEQGVAHMIERLVLNKGEN